MNALTNTKSNNFTEMLFTEKKGKIMAIWYSFIAAIVSLLTFLPVFKWIKVVNTAPLFESLKTNADAMEKLKSAYTAFDLLGFVQHANAGKIGLYAGVMLIVACATVYFQIAYIVKVLRNYKGKKGNLDLYSAGEAAMFFNLLNALGMIGLVIYSNYRFGMKGFVLMPFAYIELAMGILGMIVVKVPQSAERTFYHENGLLKELKKNWVLFVFLIPTFVYFLINFYLPMIGIYYAFTNFNFRDGLWASPFTGLKNFEFLVKGGILKTLVRNTVLYNIVFIFVGNILQIIFAIFVSRVTVNWYKKTTQTLMFMPYFVSFVILKVISYNIMEYDKGVINTMIVAMGGERIDIYNSPAMWPGIITFFYIWKNIGYGMVVYLATIMGIDAELYDAAKVDGANVFQQIRFITMPHLKPTFIILLLYALGSIMKGQFDLFYQMVGKNGILYNVTDILDTYVYRTAIVTGSDIGLATAAGVFQSIFGFLLVVFVNWAIKKKSPEYALF